MKELLQVLWVLLVHYISCRIAGWETSVSLFILAMVIIWQGIFALINHSIHKRKKTCNKKDVSPLVYLIFSALALFSPLLAVMIFMGLPVYRLCAIGGITVGDRPFKEQFVFDRNFQNDPFPNESESRNAITAGLPMCGTLEPAGNPYGVWEPHRSHNSSDS